MITPELWSNITGDHFESGRLRYCTARPRYNDRESEDTNNRRQAAWYVGCQHDIATAETADQRGKCVENLRDGNGDYWGKFIIHAGKLGDFGWDIGNNQDQGFDKACAQQTVKLLIESNNRKVAEDAECRRKYPH
jgi:hypothetical protein